VEFTLAKFHFKNKYLRFIILREKNLLSILLELNIIFERMPISATFLARNSSLQLPSFLVFNRLDK